MWYVVALCERSADIRVFRMNRVEAWGVRHVLQYGPEAEVLEPAWMRELVVERLQQMAAPHD